MNFEDIKSVEDFLIEPFRGDYKIFDVDKAIAYLLIKGVIYVCSREYVEDVEQHKDSWEINETICLFVLCNDVFLWASSDFEPITHRDRVDGGKNELYDLLNLYINHPGGWGSVKWVSLKRNMKPQAPMVKVMLDVGAWDDELEDLPDNPSDGDSMLAKDNFETYRYKKE